ncbi:MAG TPA: sigma-54 dependent transcriptional regulator [Gemmatimonadales bacterium]|nr:sigma-54 dependent transcriptional regulator [Gemmatimonadales bacterium]
MNRRVLVVDDEKGIREALQQVLEYEEIEVQACASGSEALVRYAEFRPHLVFLDVKMQGMDGLETLRKLRELDARAQVVMISGHGTIQTAVEATQLGAYDFLEKPLDTDRILLTLRNALQHLDLTSENVRLKAEVHAQYEIVGSSRGVKQVIERIEKVAPTAARVLITGENGTGKELVARAIHTLSTRARGPFVEVNCAAIPTELIESELFGHMKGSFTGAFADRAGKFELADGGTLFLDEIGDMSLSAQAKVLRALEEGVISRVGSGKTLEVDVRVVAATNKDLQAEIGAGRFREDLLYRLNVVPIDVPPLRARRADVPQLVEHFVAEMGRGGGGGGLPAKRFDPEAVKRLAAHDWPGNIRELKNAIERLLILAPGPVVTVDDVERVAGVGSGDGAGGGGGGGGAGRGVGAADVAHAPWMRAATFEEFKQVAERTYILAKLKENDWNVSETARTLEMPRSNLYKKIERYGLARGGG